MKATLRSITHFFFPPLAQVPALITCILCFVFSAGVLTLFFFVQPIVPLFYSLAEPQEYLAPKVFLFLLPGMSWLVFLINTALMRTLRGHMAILQQIFAWVSCVIVTLFLIAFLRIVLIIW